MLLRSLLCALKMAAHVGRVDDSSRGAKKRRKTVDSETFSSSSSGSDVELHSDSGESWIDYLTPDESEDESTDDINSSRVWSKIYMNNIPHSPPRFPFTGSPRINVQLDEGGGVVEYFLQFFL